MPTKMTKLNEHHIRALSIVADRDGNDGLFAVCARASRGDRAARIVCATTIRGMVAAGKWS